MSTVAKDGVVFTLEGPVATVVIERPDDGNRLSREVLAQLKEIAARLKVNPEVHVLAIRGHGSDCFSMGVFGPVRRAALSKEQALAVVALANEVIDAIEALPQIVVAGINGQIRGGGAELALGCDIRIAAEHARLAFPEARMGGFPGAGAAVRLPAAVGNARALELLCTGREIDAAEMLRIGFVERMVESKRFDDELASLVATIASCGPLATRGAKRVVKVRSEPGFRAARELSDALRNALEYSRDVDEGIAAHREGRAPKFTGR